MPAAGQPIIRLSMEYCPIDCQIAAKSRGRCRHCRQIRKSAAGDGLISWAIKADFLKQAKANIAKAEESRSKNPGDRLRGMLPFFQSAL